jgi:hypothetical protein
MIKNNDVEISFIDYLAEIKANPQSGDVYEFSQDSKDLLYVGKDLDPSKTLLEKPIKSSEVNHEI